MKHVSSLDSLNGDIVTRNSERRVNNVVKDMYGWLVIRKKYTK